MLREGSIKASNSFIESYSRLFLDLVSAVYNIIASSCVIMKRIDETASGNTSQTANGTYRYLRTADSVVTIRKPSPKELFAG